MGDRCEMGPPRPTDGQRPTPDTGDRPGGGGDFYGIEAQAVQLYRKGQGSRKAGGDTVSQVGPLPEQRPGETRDVLTPPDSVRPGGDRPAQPGKDVYQGAEIKDALKYAKDNNLPVFIRMGSDGCPGCVSMKPMWAQAEKDLRGKAVFLNIDSNSIGQLPADAQALINPIIAGTRRIPAVWQGSAVDDGAGGLKFQGNKLSNPFGVSEQLDAIRRQQPQGPGPDRSVVPQPSGTRDILPPPPGPVRPTDRQPTANDQTTAVQGQEVFEGNDIKAALAYAEQNKLPVFFRYGSENCGPCRGMKPMWAKAQADLKGKAVFIHVDSDMLASGQYSQEATNLIRPIVAGTRTIPAVWTGTAENGRFNLQKLPVAQSVITQLDRLRGQ